jgi:hypothetical protein
MIWKNGGKMFWPGWNSFSECVSSFCREGPNAGKPGPCPDPEKAKRRAEIKAGKVKVEPKKIEAKTEWKGHDEEEPLRYKDFIAAGNADKDWERYAAEVNAISGKKREAEFVDSWQSGKPMSGNGLMNHFRSNGIDAPEKVKKNLQHDDTTVSLDKVVARGLPRSEAEAIHKFVVESMGKLHGTNTEPKPTESLSDLRKKHKEEYEAHTKAKDEIEKQLSRMKGKAKTSKQKEDIDRQWEDFKTKHDARGQEILKKGRETIQAHPEYAAEMKASLERLKVKREGEQANEAKRSQERDAANLQKIESLGGADAVRAKMESDLKKAKASHNKTSDKNKWKTESKVKKVERDINELDKLTKSTKPKPPGLFDGKDTPPSPEYLRLKAMRLKHAATGSMYVEARQQ